MFNLKIKGGVLANFNQDNNFDISRATSSHSKFRFKKPKDLKGEFKSLAPISLDYLVSLGTEFNLKDHFSLAIEPTIIGEISSSHIDRFIESSKFSAGLNMSLVYNF